MRQRRTYQLSCFSLALADSSYSSHKIPQNPTKAGGEKIKRSK